MGQPQKCVLSFPSSSSSRKTRTATATTIANCYSFKVAREGCVRQLVVVIAALMPTVHIDMTRSALFIPSSTKAIIFVVVAQFLLIYIDEMCVTTATTTSTTTSRKRNENENENTSNNGNNNNNNRKLRSRRLCLLSYHAQLDNFHLPKRPGRPERKTEQGREWDSWRILSCRAWESFL